MLKELWVVIRLIVREAIHDGITGEAAKAAYYFSLSLFPAILATFALTGLVGGEDAFTLIVDWLHRSLPGSAAEYLSGFVSEVTGNERPALLSFGLLFAIISASNVFAVLMEGLNIMFDVEESRPFWKRRLLALIAFLASIVLLIGGSVVLLAGPEIGRLLGLSRVWELARWPLAFAGMTAMMWLVYVLFPNRNQRKALRPALIGAVVGTTLWLTATVGFRVYVANFSSYDRLYGFVGGVMVLLLWLYLTAFTILLGGEVAATLEQRRLKGVEVGAHPEVDRRAVGK